MEGIDLAWLIQIFKGFKSTLPCPAGFANFCGAGQDLLFAGGGRGGAHIPAQYMWSFDPMIQWSYQVVSPSSSVSDISHVHHKVNHAEIIKIFFNTIAIARNYDQVRTSERITISQLNSKYNSSWIPSQLKNSTNYCDHTYSFVGDLYWGETLTFPKT